MAILFPPRAPICVSIRPSPSPVAIMAPRPVPIKDVKRGCSLMEFFGPEAQGAGGDIMDAQKRGHCAGEGMDAEDSGVAASKKAKATRTRFKRSTCRLHFYKICSNCIFACCMQRF